jgi:hypothetical protein
MNKTYFDEVTQADSSTGGGAESLAGRNSAARGSAVATQSIRLAGWCASDVPLKKEPPPTKSRRSGRRLTRSPAIGCFEGGGGARERSRRASGAALGEERKGTEQGSHDHRPTQGLF